VRMRLRVRFMVMRAITLLYFSPCDRFFFNAMVGWHNFN
jgi:hypothetical protein